MAELGGSRIRRVSWDRTRQDVDRKADNWVMQFLLLGVAVVMYLVWRVWTEARGGDASPTGHWHSRTDAMSEYMERTNPGSTRPRGRRLFWILVLVVLELAFAVGACTWAVNRADR